MNVCPIIFIKIIIYFGLSTIDHFRLQKKRFCVYAKNSGNIAMEKHRKARVFHIKNENEAIVIGKFIGKQNLMNFRVL